MKTGLMAGGIALLATLGLSLAASAGPAQDNDGDGVFNVLDNCSDVPNGPPQDCDTDDDGYGNICDGDFDNDLGTLPNDFTDIWTPDFTTTGLDGGSGTDMDCDGYVLSNDFTDLWSPQFSNFGIPGPSGLNCAGTVPCDL
jgi:hypothetical protein